MALLWLTGMTGSSQQPEFPAVLQEKFDRFVRSVPWEDVYLHTDKQEYIAGEMIWMKGYTVDRQSALPVTGRRLLRVEVLNAGNRPVAQTRMLLDGGSGPGSLRLPDTLSTGTYLLRAFTGATQDFLPDHCFMREIRISNALDLSCNREMTLAPTPVHPSYSTGRQNGYALRYATKTGRPVAEITLSGTLLSEQAVWLCIQSRGHIRHLSGHQASTGTTRVALPDGVLQPGVNQLTLFDVQGRPVAEIYVFLQEGRKEEGKIPETMQAGSREEIVLTAGNTGIELPDIFDYSISVAPQAVCVQQGLAAYLVAGSEFGYNPGIPDASGAGDTVELDLQSRWINWDVILSDRQSHNYRQVREESGFLSGRLLHGELPAPAGLFVLLCMPGKEAVFQAVRTDSLGDFRFILPPDEAIRDLVVLPDNVSSNPRIVFDTDPAVYPAWQAADTVWPQQMAARQSVNYQVQSIYRKPFAGDPTMPRYPLEHPRRFYGRPDIELRMADYIQLPVMEEVFNELLPDVSLKRKKEDVAVEIIRRDVGGLAVTEPCLMVDGVVVKDAALFTGIDPEAVEKIDVIRETYVSGDYRFPGIINVITKSGDFSVVSQPPYMSRIKYRVIDPVPAFPKPDYSNAETRATREPDYRNTLLWDPGHSAGQSGKPVTLTTSDNAGDYLLQLEGIMPDGRIVSLRRVIRVE